MTGSDPVRSAKTRGGGGRRAGQTDWSVTRQCAERPRTRGWAQKGKRREERGGNAKSEMCTATGRWWRKRRGFQTRKSPLGRNERLG